MRRRIRNWLTSLSNRYLPAVSKAFRDQQAIGIARSALADAQIREQADRARYIERCHEMLEARQMSGSGPWLVHESRTDLDKPGRLRESNPITSAGATADLNLMLENLEWRREVNLSWLEFSRWGIQQIILISRLYYIKNPIIRRLIDISAYYVFGRGVEVSSPDETANQVLREFFERNKKIIGQIALTKLQRRKYYDGNLFFGLFSDTESTGQTNVRLIDATEIQDIVCNPDDSEEPWYYRRQWTQRNFDPQTGRTETKTQEAWYPELQYDPADKPTQINGIEVKWECKIHHRKCGEVGSWQFGCPMIYPALDWAREARKYLEACASVKQSLSQIAMTLTTKGGQQAIAGAKQQLETTAGPPSSIWDTNPSAVSGSTFASGPGTVLAAFNTRGAGGDPEEVRQYKLMCCIVVGIPETFLADVSTGNLATATTLDRPTELCFLEKQETWRDDLMTIAKYVIKVSAGAPSGKLKESLDKRKIGDVTIREAAREMGADGRLREVWKLKKKGKRVELWEADQKVPESEILISVNFPAIREGDLPQLVAATVDAMTLGNRGGQVVGIDEKAGVRHLYDLIGMEDGDELTEEQYPDSEYEPDRTKEVLPEAIPKLMDLPGGTPAAVPREAITRSVARLLVREVMRDQGMTGDYDLLSRKYIQVGT